MKIDASAWEGMFAAMPSISNPFFFELPSDAGTFTDRETLIPVLHSCMKQKGRRVLVHGLRRMGKTSLLKNAGRLSGEVFVFADISTATNLNEVARKLLASAPVEAVSLLPRLVELAGKFLSSFTVSAGGVSLSGELRAEDWPKNLEEVLSYLNARAGAENRPWTICLDEFQDIRLLGGDRAEWQLRGFIQEHRNLNYIFSGSDNRLVKWMNEPGAAFYRQLQTIEVGPIEEGHMARWIEKRARAGGLAAFPHGKAIIQFAGPRTGDIVRLAMVCFDLAVAGKIATADLVRAGFDFIALEQMAPEFVLRWQELPMTQRTVLRALADGQQPTAAATLRRFGIKSTSSAQTALESMLQRQILVREKPARVVFDNPFFKRWVAANGV